MTWSPGGSGKGWGVGGSQGGPHTWPMGRETPPAPSWAPSPRERWRTARRGSGRRWTAGSLGGMGAVSAEEVGEAADEQQEPGAQHSVVEPRVLVLGAAGPPDEEDQASCESRA